MRKHDPEILAQLLNEPEIKEKTERMTSQELGMFKTLLVARGVYTKYALELQKKQLEEMGNDIKKSTPKATRKRHKKAE